MDDPIPTARVGDPVLAEAWNRMRRAAREGRVLAGRNARVARFGGLGQMVSFEARPAVFTGRFRVGLSGSRVTVGYGAINDLEPRIAGRPVSGDAEGRQPELELDAEAYDGEGRSWLAVRITVDPELGRLPDPVELDGAAPPLEVVQRDRPGRGPGEPAEVHYWTIALLKRPPGSTGFGRAIQRVWFDQQHFFRPPSTHLLHPVA